MFVLAVVKVNHRQSPQNEITLAPLREVGPLLSHAVFLQGQGPGWGCVRRLRPSSSCVRRLNRRLDRPRARNHGQSKPGLGGFRLLRELLLLRIRREASAGGGWRVLKSGPDSLLCVCVSRPSFVFVHLCIPAATTHQHLV